MQIFVEIERARLTKQLAKLKEEEGKVDEAAEILQEVAVVSHSVVNLGLPCIAIDCIEPLLQYTPDTDTELLLLQRSLCHALDHTCRLIADQDKNSRLGVRKTRYQTNGDLAPERWLKMRRHVQDLQALD